VQDERKLIRLRERLDQERTKTRSLRAQLKNADKRLERLKLEPRKNMLAEVDRLTDRLADAQAKIHDLKTLNRPVRTVENTAKLERAEQRLSDAQRQIAELREINTELESRIEEMRNSALAQVLVDARVQAAEARADAAAKRAAEIEKEMAIQGAAVVGELRALTSAEIEELRRKGPAGRSVLAKANMHLIHVLRTQGEMALIDPLTELAAAAINWRDRIR
jgi:predicted  nucleic acid-binding Zn-ribbon protein